MGLVFPFCTTAFQINLSKVSMEPFEKLYITHGLLCFYLFPYCFLPVGCEQGQKQPFIHVFR